MGKRIAITGAGLVCSLGMTKAQSWEALMAGRSGFEPFTLFPTEGFRNHRAAQIKGDLKQAVRPWLKGLTKPGRVSRTDMMGIIAAAEAAGEAGMEVGGTNPRTGICMGSTTGGMYETESYLMDFPKTGYSRSRISPVLLHPSTNTADNIAQIFHLGGPSSSQMSACSSSGAAIGFASDLIRCGMADAMLAGGSEGFCRLSYSGFNCLRLTDPGECKPFDKNRKGLSLGEGAGVLFLEEWEAAKKRGAVILAEFLGYGLNCDAYHMTTPTPDGSGAAACMELALERSGIQPEEVSYINAHGTGTRRNDAMEALAIRRCFGDATRKIPVSSTKSIVGHTLGSAGAVEAVLSLLALEHQTLPPTLGHREPDETVTFDCVPGRPRPHKIDVAVSNSFGFGGGNVSLVLALPDFWESRHDS